MPTPATETSSTLLPPDLDALLANFAKSSTEETSVIVPGIVSPSWCENIAERKYAYLTGLTNNHHYRQIAEWYVSQKVRVLISFQGLIYKSKYLIACAANHRSAHYLVVMELYLSASSKQCTCIEGEDCGDILPSQHMVQVTCSHF